MINIILYHPEIPANTGNILRTAMASNSKVHIIGPIPFSLDDKSLKRAGMDYLLDANYVYYENYEQFVKQIGDVEIYYVTKYGKQLYCDVDFKDPASHAYIMFGRESTGIDKEILKEHLDHTLRIPMLSTARSLNLSNCVALVTYDILRQKKFPGLATFDMIHKYDI